MTGRRDSAGNCWLMLGISIILLGGCGPAVPPPVPSVPVVSPSAPPSGAPSLPLAPAATLDSPLRFQLMTPQSGVDFVYYGGPTAECHMTEQNGGGTALIDYDSDGRLDLFLTNGSNFERPAETLGASQQLCRARGDFQFQPVTAPARLTAFGFGMGAAAGDFDNDGFIDLFVAGYGQNHLWHNCGDGTWEELQLPPLPSPLTWGTSAAFADLDADGLLDLFVVNYVDWSPSDPPCYSDHQGQPIRISCSPVERRGQADALYHNLGDGTFEEVAEQSGVGLAVDGKGLAIAVADLDGDGRLDVYVANDTTRNYLFRNQGELRFAEEGVARGAAYSAEGVAGSSMGIACGDYNRDGRLDLFVTNFLNQTDDALENLGEAGFRPVNAQLGLDTASRATLSFGIILSDFDLDGWPDQFVANGHIWDLTPLGLDYELEMTQQLFWNRRGKRFVDVSATGGDYFRQKWLGRSAAIGDLDGDGDTDLVVGHLKQPPGILQNVSVRGGNSLIVKFVGVTSTRQPLGCRVEVELSDAPALVTTVPSGGSFQAAFDDVVIAAAGPATNASEVRIVWPNRIVERWKNVPTGSLQRLVEGTGDLRSALPAAGD